MIVGESSSDFEMVVVGLGKTGLSCARFLSALGVAYVVTDSRTEPPGASVLARELPGVRQILGGFDFEMLEPILMNFGANSSFSMHLGR